MATVVQGGLTTETKRATNRHAGKVNLQEKITAEQAVDKPVVYISRKGADAAFLRSPKPIYNASGHFIGDDPGIRLEFTNGISNPFYPTKNPIHKREVAEIDEIIAENWPIVEDLGLVKQEAGQPLPPLKRWDHLGLDTIKAALSANFQDDFEKNVAMLEQGVRYEMSKPKKEQRKDLIQALEGMVQVEAAEVANVDPLDV